MWHETCPGKKGLEAAACSPAEHLGAIPEVAIGQCSHVCLPSSHTGWQQPRRRQLVIRALSCHRPVFGKTSVPPSLGQSLEGALGQGEMGALGPLRQALLAVAHGQGREDTNLGGSVLWG